MKFTKNQIYDTFICKNPPYNHIHDNFCAALWFNPYLSALDFWHSLVFKFEFDELDFYCM